MKKSILVALAIVGGTVANADNYPYQFSVRLGVIVPIDKSFSAISDNFSGAGVDYTLARSFVAGGESYVSLDYIGKNFGKTKGSVIPLMLNQKWWIGEVEPGKRPYYFVGLGVAFVDYTGSETVAAGRIGAGKEFSNNVFGEVALNITDRASGVRANGLGIYIGYRF